MAATKSPLMRLGHIRDEIANLLPLFTSVNYSTFASSYSMVRTTERAILIIAEAGTALPAELTARYPEIEWHAIRGIPATVTNTSASKRRCFGGWCTKICRRLPPQSSA